MVAVGVALFAVGIIAAAALFVTPAVAGGLTAPLWVYLCTPLAPIGLAVSVAAVVVSESRR